MPAPSRDAAPPRLSIVVTVVDGGATLEGCLEALAAQRDPPDFEVLVPRDPSLPDLRPTLARFGKRFRPVEMEPVRTERSPQTHAGQHELYDRRRSCGLRAARGDLIAILEDRSRPEPEWAAAADRLHASGHAVIGGAIVNGVDRLLNWAVYFCDFGRYEPPLRPGPAPWVSDVNVVYKRRALEATRELWAERYHETTVHWALRRAGETLLLSPELRVGQHRAGLRLGDLLRERFHWGRLFATTRARESTIGRRLLLALGAPLLPLLLFGRLLRGRVRRRVNLGRFARATPAILLLLLAWCAGEAVGYVTRRG